MEWLEEHRNAYGWAECPCGATTDRLWEDKLSSMFFSACSPECALKRAKTFRELKQSWIK